MLGDVAHWRGRWWATTGIAVISLAFWSAASFVLNAPEPWDSEHYGTAFLLALGLIALASFALPDEPWRWAIIFVAAQLPVMVVRSEAGPLWAVGLMFLLAECIPAVVIALLAGWLRRRLGRA